MPAVHVAEPPAFLEKLTLGLDWGLHSPTAAITLGRDSGNRLWAIAEYYQRNSRESDLVDWLAAQKQLGAKLMVADPSAKTWIEGLHRLSLPVTQARSNEQGLRISLIASRLGGAGRPAGLFISGRCPNLITELQQAAWHQPRGLEMLTDRLAPGCQDHAIDALAYALMEFEHWVKGKPPQVAGRIGGW